MHKKISKACDNYVITIGIQGGLGSFNEEALVFNWKNQSYEVKYLYTTKKVFEELNKGTIDYGQFAISNKLGGLVDETIEVIGEYKFKIKAKYKIKIEQCLIANKNTNLKKIKIIMSHPQGFAQCTNNLNKYFPKIKQVVGRGKFIDPAYLAKELSTNKLNNKIAIIGNKRLAEIYNLSILKRNLQDDQDNWTTFLLVSKFKSESKQVVV